MKLPFVYSLIFNTFFLIEKRYSNLCALCEDPTKCDYPDKYSGYEGAIRCLVENGGDVAFTKVIFVRKFFGVISRYISLLFVAKIVFVCIFFLSAVC